VPFNTNLQNFHPHTLLNENPQDFHLHTLLNENLQVFDPHTLPDENQQVSHLPCNWVEKVCFESTHWVSSRK